MKAKILRAGERGHANHGWLDTYHSFSFSDYYNPEWMGYRTLRVMNDDLVMPGMGFGMHPHKDMEIISYILSGSLAHKDSMGNGRTITAGEFQYMSAGSGVRHSEFNPSKQEATRLLQIWIKPDEQGAEPRYAEKSFKDTPSGVLKLVASKTGRDDSMSIRQDADLWHARLQAGEAVTHRTLDGRHLWLQVAEGEITLDGDDAVTLAEGDAIALESLNEVTLTASKTSQVLLFDLN